MKKARGDRKVARKRVALGIRDRRASAAGIEKRMTFIVEAVLGTREKHRRLICLSASCAAVIKENTNQGAAEKLGWDRTVIT